MSEPATEQLAPAVASPITSDIDSAILENLIGHPNFKEEAEAVVEGMLQEYSDDTSYFDRFESLEYWDEEDEKFDMMAAQYEVSFGGKGKRGAHVSAGPKQGKAKRADARSEAIAAVGGVLVGKGRGREEVVVEEEERAVARAPAPVAYQAATAKPSAASALIGAGGRAEDSSHLFNPKLILQIVDTIDKKYALITKNQQYSRVVPTEIPLSDLKALVAGYDHMMNTLNLPRFMSKYGGKNRVDLRFGDSVPNYFANVCGESMYERKSYSIAGLRNLLRSGAGIYSELASSFFSYPKAINGALNRMRCETGNVVDLDTVVLRVSSSTTINMINASNKAKGLPTYHSASEFGDSEQAREIAVNLASVALLDFQRALKITDAQLKSRAGHPEQIGKVIPTAHDNSTRGHVPLWRYMNCGQDSFHANCPELEDVVGALLRAPLHCVYHYAYLFSGVYGPWKNGEAVRSADDDANGGSGGSSKTNTNPSSGNKKFSKSVPQGLADKLDAFFEDCVADSCFNRKWRSIEEFGEMLKHEGTITHVLQLLQLRHQTEMLAFYDEQDAMPEEEEEKAESGAVVEAANAEETQAEPKEDEKPAAAADAETGGVVDEAEPTTIKPANKVLVVSKVPVPPPANDVGMGLPLNSTAIHDPPKRASEIDFIYNLIVREGGLLGRDESSGNNRFITRSDVAAFVRATSGV